jgi:hypothetical protein
LLLVGFIAFTAAYVAYAQLLGWIDGLPQLPEHMLKQGVPDFLPPKTESPTQRRLADAFGPKSPETNYALYPNQFTFVNGETLIVLASGPVPNNPDSTRVPLTPFSLAIFGKPKPPHLRLPGEVAEITTVHADKGILEFDQKITSPSEMRTAKLVGLELVSDDQTIPDRRQGTVHIENNQRSADENRRLTIRTVGPVFYRDAKAMAGRPAPQGPDFWTDAPVVIVDRQNLPRAVGADVPEAAATKTEDARTGRSVQAMLAGQRSPPPTVTAVGMRVYLEPPPADDKPAPKKSGTGLQGMRRIEFLEQVVVHLWVDNGQSLVGDDAPPAPDRSPDAPPAGGSGGLALIPPPAALAAVTGNLGTAPYTARLMNRALLQIETRGPFFYDAEKSLARFDVVPQSDPNLPNDVRTTKVPARAGADTLFSQVLELELNGGATAGNRPAGAPPINKMHAWMTAAGRVLTIASTDEKMVAYGRDLLYERAVRRTTLVGEPLTVIRDSNVLVAGSPQRSATLTSEPAPADPKPSGEPAPAGAKDRKSQLKVRGPGRIDLFDAAANAPGPTATWLTSMVQTKETVNKIEQDLFTFTDGAKFEDKKADYSLQGNVLKLWLDQRAADKTGEDKARGVQTADDRPRGDGPSAAPQPKPSRIQAIGKVTSHSTDYDIIECTQLNVFFADPKPTPTQVVVAPAAPHPGSKGDGSPAPAAGGPPAAPGAAPPAGGAPAVAADAPPAEPEKPKPPYKIRAKYINSHVLRVPVPPKPGAAPKAEPGKAADSVATKYQLDHAEFDESVTIHQDPTELNKARGVDVLGRFVKITGSPGGNIMDVFGWTDRPGEVHQEDMSLLGPEIKLDQVHNAAHVTGRGALTMPTSSDLSGTELAQPEVVIVNWRDEMDFKGTARLAKFEGKVFAKQGDSWVLCHTMNVTFDRPVYFNQTAKPAPLKPKDAKGPKDPKGADDDKAKIDTVFCFPAPGDAAETVGERRVMYSQVDKDKAGKIVKSQQLVAQDIRMFAQFQDARGGEKYQLVEANGPRGVLRIWQPGDKDPAGPSPGGNKPAQPGQTGPPGQNPGGQPAAKQADKSAASKPTDADQEMKLTVVEFDGRMTAIDKAKVYQHATFRDNIRVTNVPADSPTYEIPRHSLPPRSFLLRCNNQMIVWSHKRPNEPTVQHMDAAGNAFIRSDEYDGWAETITNDGQLVVLKGSELQPAQVSNRYDRGTHQIGEEITYNRATGALKMKKAQGGPLGGSK